MGDLVQAVSTVISLLSAAISVYFATRTRRDTRIQHQMQFSELKHQYYSELQKWADEVVDVITETIFLCDLDPREMQAGEFFSRCHANRQKISALIDRGRFFFQNEYRDKYGRLKPTAYQGLRQRVLDQVVAVYDVTREFTIDSPNLEFRSALWKLRQNFVSELQNILNPSDREQAFKELLQGIRQ